jgi:CheY-like chemotaxis protein
MTARRALVVDDSRSARAFLTRILERYELQVDAVETAEQAIDYLTRQRPDVIFMDHLMPGMDGFQAVQAIKNNPRTATIPIMMYTSQEGELYLSQARALGAIGVLPKQIKHADVSKALEQLRLRPEDEHVQQAAPLPVEDIPARTVARAQVRTDGRVEAPEDARSDGRLEITMERRSPDRPNIPPLPPELRTILEAMFAHHGRELRRFVVDNLETQADRILGDMRLLLRDSMPEPVLEPPSAAHSAAPWLAAAGFALAAVFGALFWQRSTQLNLLNARLTQSQQQLAQAQQDLQAATAKAAAAAAAAAQSQSQSQSGADAGASGDHTSSLIESVPFGEIPLSGARVEQVSDLLARLSAEGFHGVVQIRSIPGRYCMVSGPGGTLVPANDQLPYAKCDQVGNPREDDDSGAARQSVAFADMLSTARAAGNVDVQVSAGDADEVAHPYPSISDSLTAGDWNRAAAANNRVELHWQATTP